MLMELTNKYQIDFMTKLRPALEKNEVNEENIFDLVRMYYGTYHNGDGVMKELTDMEVIETIQNVIDDVLFFEGLNYPEFNVEGQTILYMLCQYMIEFGYCCG